MAKLSEAADASQPDDDIAGSIEDKVAALLAQMTLEEKIGQLNIQDAGSEAQVNDLAGQVRQGQVGAVLNQTDPVLIERLQRVAVEESRLGIPMLIARDVIHGFKTIMPIPLGQAASWNPELIKAGAQVAARESAAVGVNWTFAPMVDISRDARWGRIAESLGEDPFLAGELGAAMVEGFQGEDLGAPGSVAACVKHFCGYGASEAGRDYSATNIPENELHNIYLQPFKAAIDAGALSIMASFSDIDGIPATGNEYLLSQVLREDWNFDGMLVSDWNAVHELSVHGLTADDKESAHTAFSAGVDMEMAGECYNRHLRDLLEQGRVPLTQVDKQVANVLRMKFRLGLFERDFTAQTKEPDFGSAESLQVAEESAIQSLVLLKNEDSLLPLQPDKLKSVAVIGPLADAPYEQLGTWIFDGEPGLSVTPLSALTKRLAPDTRVDYCKALSHSRSTDTGTFDEAVSIAENAEHVLLFLGEESILSGEAHCRADIGLPGAQASLLQRLAQTGKPITLVVMAGRPLALTNIIEYCDAVLYAWHPGSMAGPAIAKVLSGERSPSGKLPVTFPNSVGQIPIYYNHKNTGRPATDESVVLIDDIPEFAEQTSLGMTAFHLDAGFKPLFAFGYGLSYGDFEYSNLTLAKSSINFDEKLELTVTLKNLGRHKAEEVVQLYIRDLVASVTRPVKELKAFKRVALEPGNTAMVSFSLASDQLSFYNRHKQWQAEPGHFQLWVGGSSDSGISTEFDLQHGQ